MAQSASSKKEPGTLQKGDVVGVIAVSASCRPDLFEKGVQGIRSHGFEVKVALDPVAAYGKDTYLFSSDTPERRANALMELFLDPKVKAIIAARGAYGSLEILPHLDFDKIGSNPKPLVGFSDVTALLIAINEKSKIMTIHGPTASGAFAQSEPNALKSRECLLKVLGGEHGAGFVGQKFEEIRKGEGRGVLSGGSLSMVSTLVGTPWQPDLNGKVLFIEEVGEKPYRISRMLMQLKLAGMLNNLAGVLVGELKECTHTVGPTVQRVLKEVFRNFSYPIYLGGHFGHGDLNLSVPLGLKVQLRDGTITTAT